MFQLVDCIPGERRQVFHPIFGTDKMPGSVQTRMPRRSSIIPTALLLCLGLAVAPATVTATPEPFVMTTSVGAPLYKENGSGIYSQLVREIFTRLGIEY